MGQKLWKFAVLLVNILLLVLGVIIIALGIWVLAIDYRIVKLSKIQENGLYPTTLEEPGLLDTAAVICIVVGGVLIVVSALTFHAVRKESTCLLAVGAALLITLSLMDIIVIILTGIMQRRAEDHLQSALQEGVRSHYEGIVTSRFPFSIYFDRAQVQFECCGVNNYTDIKNNATMWGDKLQFMIPGTCCILSDKSAYLEDDTLKLRNTNCARGPSDFHEKPCYGPIKDWVTEKSFVLLGVSAVIASVKILGAILDIVLLQRFKNDAPYNDL